MLFVNSIFPLLDGLTSLALTWLEMVKAQMSTKIALCNAQIKQAANQEDVKRAIGFVCEDEPEPEEEEEYEDE